MEQVGTHAPALFAAQAGSAERADYTLNLAETNEEILASAMEDLQDATEHISTTSGANCPNRPAATVTRFF